MKIERVQKFKQVSLVIGVGLSLTKTIITIPIALTCFVGTLIASPQPSWNHLCACIAVWLMASASSIINQIQERHFDKKMNRTKQRPLPANQVTVSQAWTLVIILIIGSFITLNPVYNPLSTMLLVGTLLWYNLIYTPLKQITPFAVIPGAVTGMMPPLIGFSFITQTGHFSSQILLVAMFLFIGQIPHFWLLLLLYNKEYKQAGFPVLTDYLSPYQVKRLSFIWSFLVFCFALFLFSTGMLSSETCTILGYMLTILLILLALFKIHKTKKVFMILNTEYLLFILLIVIDRIMSS